jgi:hypothetical protein
MKGASTNESPLSCNLSNVTVALPSVESVDMSRNARRDEEGLQGEKQAHVEKEDLYIVTNFTGNLFPLKVEVQRTETIKEVEEALLAQSKHLHLGKSPKFRFYSGIWKDNEHESHLSKEVTIKSLMTWQGVEGVNKLNIYVKKCCKRKRHPYWK